jgi:ferredoxin-NADP reductase
MVVALPGEALRQRLTATVESKVLLNRDILRLQLSVPKPLEYEAGQYIQLERADGLTRSYSLASLPSEPLLELHVRRLPDGAMSRWLADEIQPGSTVTIAGPSGSMFYAPGMPQQPLLMVATGSGLAPLWGIVRTALLQGHTGPIRLYHGSWSTEGLYLREELKALSQQHSSFTYIPCADETTDPCVRRERADAAALSDVPNSAGWRVFLCGHPEMVNSLRRKIFLAGAAFRDILADPFVNAAR